MTDKEFVCQIELLIERSLRHMGSSPPSSTRVKVESSSQLRHHMKCEPTSLLRPIKDKHVSLQHNHVI